MSYKIETKPFDVFYASNMEEYNEFKTNAAAGFNYLTKKLNTKPITSAIAMNEFITFDDMDIEILTELFCLNLMLIEKGRTQLDEIKEGISDKMLSALKNTYIEKVKIIETSVPQRKSCDS